MRVRRRYAGAAILVAAALFGCGRREPLYEVPGGDPEEGRALMHAFGCIACHFIPGENVQYAGMGPPLTRFAERHYIAGTLPNEPENLIHWIMNPQEVEPLTAMPDLGVNEREARHMAAYLYTLYDDLPPGPVDSAWVRRALQFDSVESPPLDAEKGRP